MLLFCRFLLDKTIDVLLYVDRLDVYRVDNLDRQVIRAISRSFGPQIWRLAVVVLTHAQLPAPEGLTYAEFVEKRSTSLEAAIRLEAGFKKYEPQVRSYYLTLAQRPVPKTVITVKNIFANKSMA